MYVLGLATMGEAAAALFWNGELVHAAEEERFSRRKHHVGFPFRAIASCLASAGIALADVDHIAHYWRPWMIGHRIGHTIPIFLKSPRLFRARARRGAQQLGGHYRKMFQLRSILTEAFGSHSGRLHYVEHHLGHAASAYFASPFERSAILTLDGAGESTTTMSSLGEGNRIRVLERVKLPHSLGQFYSAATNFLGFDMFQGDEYKVMGMAAYGEPTFYDFLRQNVLVTNGGAGFQLDIGFLDHHLAKHHVYTDRARHVFGPPRRPDEEIVQRHYDIAASVQRVVEETVLRLVHDLQRETGEKRLCLAGGVALNSVMNGRILREGPFEEIFIQPAANDAGGALGSALYVLHHKLDAPRRYSMRNAYCGPSFSGERCKSAARAAGLDFVELERAEVPRRGAEALASGKILAWFQGRMEWGPRALGHRSFLADPRNPQMKEILNERIKLREPFRPFAPSMIEEAASRYFGSSVSSPYMLIVLPVVAERRTEIPAVVHVDGTARPQTVSRAEEPLYWELIHEFEKRSGVPVLLNTSFNIQEPIVCSPEEAIATFLRSSVDSLVLENVWIDHPRGNEPTQLIA
jgi:carbamoyltransferase